MALHTTQSISWQRIIFALNIGAAVVFLLLAWQVIHIDNGFQTMVGCVSALTFFIPRLLFYYTPLGRMLNRRGLAVIELVTGILLVQHAFGALYLYDYTAHYDDLLHITGPIGAGILLFIVVSASLHARKKYSLIRAQFWSVVGSLLIVFSWELVEYTGDYWLGTSMSGQIGQPLDTLYDMLDGLAAQPLLWIINQRFISRLNIWKL